MEHYTNNNNALPLLSFIKMKTLKTEEEFDTFVRLFGGEKVSDIVGASPDFENADYLFDKFNVIAELKCLEEDKIKSENLTKKASAIYMECFEQSKAPVIVFGTRIITTENFPEAYTEKIANLYKNPIQKRIVKANKQIKETKKRLNRENHTGLLLLVNDNNTALDPSHILWILNKIFQGNNYSSINDIVFFTVNLKSEHPDIDKDLMLWIPIGRPGFNTCGDEFIFKLHDGWISYLESITGQAIPKNESIDPEKIEQISNIRR